jgi:hypothetical protein
VKEKLPEVPIVPSLRFVPVVEEQETIITVQSLPFIGS